MLQWNMQVVIWARNSVYLHNIRIYPYSGITIIAPVPQISVSVPRYVARNLMHLGRE